MVQSGQGSDKDTLLRQLAGMQIQQMDESDDYV